jgi:membrane-associated phospholipid phosphatase
MLTSRRLTAYTAGLTLALALLVQQVVGIGWFSGVDRAAYEAARSINASRDIFSVTVMFGLRGIILAVCLPWLAWLSWRRKSWLPIGGFVLVLVFETGIAGALKISVGRIFPYQLRDYFDFMRLETDEMAFPSGHAANAVALWGYVAWFVTQERPTLRKVLYTVVAIGWIVVGISSWLLRTHWPTDILAGFAVGGIALVTVVGVVSAVMANLSATPRR